MKTFVVKLPATIEVRVHAASPEHAMKWAQEKRGLLVEHFSELPDSILEGEVSIGNTQPEHVTEEAE